jgi:hypothetical protein
MKSLLSSAQLKALKVLRVEVEGGDYLTKGDLVGISRKTLQTLVDAGLVEMGSASRFPDDDAWRLTASGWKIADTF